MGRFSRNDTMLRVEGPAPPIGTDLFREGGPITGHAIPGAQIYRQGDNVALDFR
jgi:hypothetical protein